MESLCHNINQCTSAYCNDIAKSLRLNLLEKFNKIDLFVFLTPMLGRHHHSLQTGQEALGNSIPYGLHPES